MAPKKWHTLLQQDAPPQFEQLSATEQQSIRHLLDKFDGDIKAYRWDEAGFAPPATGWHELVESSTILPEMATATYSLVAQRLGYPPHPNRLQSQDAFLRATVVHWRSGHLTKAEFYNQLDDSVKGVRNSDIIPIRWQDNPKIAQKCYDEDLTAVAQRARARLTRFLGYEPEVKHSLAAELWLRQVLAQDVYPLPDYETVLDRKAIVYTKYHEVLAASGRGAANSSPLLGSYLLANS